MTDASDNADWWVNIPNGDYAVTVTGIEWDAEPGSDTEGFDMLPNYVVQFEPVGASMAKPAKRPPDILATMSGKATDEIHLYSSEKPHEIKTAQSYPSFASKHIMPIHRPFKSKDEAPLSAGVKDTKGGYKIFDTSFVVAAELAAGEPAMIARITGTSGYPDEAQEYSIVGEANVKIVEIVGVYEKGEERPQAKSGFFGQRKPEVSSDSLIAVRVEPWVCRADEQAKVGAAELKAQSLENLRSGGFLARELGGVANYHALRLDAMMDETEILDWMLDHFPLPEGELFRLSFLPPNALCNQLANVFSNNADC